MYCCCMYVIWSVPLNLQPTYSIQCTVEVMPVPPELGEVQTWLALKDHGASKAEQKACITIPVCAV